MVTKLRPSDVRSNVPLGLQTIAGLNAPVRAYRVVEETPGLSRFEASHGADRTPLIGRDEETAISIRRWDLAKRGEGQVLLFSGEAGIGKSRLASHISAQLIGGPHISLSYQCSPFHQQRAFAPIIVQLEAAASFNPDDSPEEKKQKLGALLNQSRNTTGEVFQLFAALLSIPGEPRLADIEPDPAQRRARIIELFVEHIRGLTHSEEFPEVAVADPGRLAYHYTEAQLFESAIEYWQRAGEQAIEAAAYREGTANLERAMKLVAELPDSSQQAECELTLRLALGAAQTQTLGHGSPIAADNYQRACDLSTDAGTDEQRFQALWGEWFVQGMARGDMRSAAGHGDALFSLAESLADPGRSMARSR